MRQSIWGTEFPAGRGVHEAGQAGGGSARQGLVGRTKELGFLLRALGSHGRF